MEHRRQGFVERGLRWITPAAPVIGGLACYVLGYGLGFSGSVIDQVTNFAQNMPHYLTSGGVTEVARVITNSIGPSIEQATYVGNIVSKPMAAGGALATWKIYRSFVDGIFGKP